MQRRVRGPEDEPLGSDGARTELTPLFWQAALGALGTLVFAGLIFVILSFAQLTQTLAKVESVASLANSLERVPVCKASMDTEWMFTSYGKSVSHLLKSRASFIDAKSLALDSSEMMGWPTTCTIRSTETCEQTTTTDVWLLLNALVQNLQIMGPGPSSMCGAHPPTDLGTVMDALCEASKPPSQSDTWPCFNIDPSKCPGEAPTNWQVQEDIVSRLALELPPPCVSESYTYAELSSQLFKSNN